MGTRYFGPALRGANAAMSQPSGHCTACVLINGIRHHIQFAILPPRPRQIILRMGFLRSAIAVIACGKPMIDITETDLGSVAHDPELHLTTSSKFTRCPGEEAVISMASDDIVDGDVLIAPT